MLSKMNINQLDDYHNRLLNRLIKRQLSMGNPQQDQRTQQLCVMCHMIGRIKVQFNYWQKQIADKDTKISKKDTDISKHQINVFKLSKQLIQVEENKDLLFSELQRLLKKMLQKNQLQPINPMSGYSGISQKLNQIHMDLEKLISQSEKKSNTPEEITTNGIVGLTTMDLELKENKDLVKTNKIQQQQTKISNDDNSTLRKLIQKNEKLQRENKQSKVNLQNRSEKLEKSQKRQLAMTKQRNIAQQLNTSYAQHNQQLQLHNKQMQDKVESLKKQLETFEDRMNKEKQMIYKKILKNIEEMQQMATIIQPPENVNIDQVEPLSETDTPMDEDKDTSFYSWQMLIKQQLHCFGTSQKNKIPNLQIKHASTLTQYKSSNELLDTIEHKNLQNQNIKEDLRQLQEVNKKLNSINLEIKKLNIELHSEQSNNMTRLQQCQMDNQRLRLQIDQHRQQGQNQLPKPDIILLVEEFLTITRENTFIHKMEMEGQMSEMERVDLYNNQIKTLTKKIQSLKPIQRTPADKKQSDSLIK